MVHKAKPDETLLIRSMGRSLRVTAMATDDDSANQYMATHKDEGVIAVFGPFVLLANLYDKGER